MTNFVEQADIISEGKGAEPLTRDSFERRIFRATVVVLLTVASAYVLWLLVDLLLLLFACTLISLILLTVSNSIRSRLKLPFAIALTISVIFCLAVLGGTFTFFGAAIQAEFTELITRLPLAWADLQGRIGTYAMGAAILERAQGLAPSGQAIVTAVTTAVAAVGGALSMLAIVLVGGLYLAAQPALYATGLLRLIPTSARNRSAETLDSISLGGADLPFAERDRA